LIGGPSSTSLNRIMHLRSLLLNALSACPKLHYTATNSTVIPDEDANRTNWVLRRERGKTVVEYIRNHSSVV
jgi:hypothetical protein